MAAARPFKHFNMPIKTDDSEELVVSVLVYISDEMKRGDKSTYLNIFDPCVVRLVIQGIIKIVSRYFALEGEKLECLEDVKGEGCLRPIK